MNTTTATNTQADNRPGTLEPRINDLYSEGHATGYGAGKATCGGGELCLGCSEVRVLAAEWTRRWQEFDRQRLAK